MDTLQRELNGTKENKPLLDVSSWLACIGAGESMEEVEQRELSGLRLHQTLSFAALIDEQVSSFIQ